VPDTRNKKEVQRLQIAAAFISNSIYMRGKGQILSAEADTKSKKEQIFEQQSEIFHQALDNCLPVLLVQVIHSAAA